MVNGHSKCILLKVATFCRKVTIRSLNLNLPLGLQCISFFPNKSQSVELANELKVYQSFQFHFLFQSADPARFTSPSLCGLVVQHSVVWYSTYSILTWTLSSGQWTDSLLSPGFIQCLLSYFPIRPALYGVDGRT